MGGGAVEGCAVEVGGEGDVDEVVEDGAMLGVHQAACAEAYRSVNLLLLLLTSYTMLGCASNYSALPFSDSNFSKSNYYYS